MGARSLRRNVQTEAVVTSRSGRVALEEALAAALEGFGREAVPVIDDLDFQEASFCAQAHGHMPRRVVDSVRNDVRDRPRQLADIARDLESGNIIRA